ncbi:MAG: hypothetical protein K2I82_02830 [Ruminococcus sp.]|nr:hypothetical protein [Ruminococcus sp.]
MDNIRKFFSFTKFMWIGGIMGFTQQIIGGLNTSEVLFDAADIMGSFGLYAAIILLLIHRDKPPKKQFLDIFLFFVGLDFFYALYIFFADISNYFAYNEQFPDNTRENVYFFQQTYGEILGFFYWTSIGTAAAVWGFLATKFRSKGWKKRYIIMLVPLFAVLVTEFTDSAVHMILYIIQECSKNNLSDGFRRGSSLGTLLTDLIGLIICSVIYLKKKKTDIQIKGTL